MGSSPIPRTNFFKESDMLISSMNHKCNKLHETVHSMLSNSYQERFLAEQAQLIIRINKLESFLDKYEKNLLDFKPNCPVELLYRQLAYMKAYLQTLNEREQYEFKQQNQE